MSNRPPVIYSAPDGSIIIPDRAFLRRQRSGRWLTAQNPLVDGVLTVLGAPIYVLSVLGAVLGGGGLALAALVYCFAFGPLGWIAAVLIVPAAGVLGASIGFFAGVALPIGLLIFLLVRALIS